MDRLRRCELAVAPLKAIRADPNALRSGAARGRCESTASVDAGIERNAPPREAGSANGTERSMNLVVWLPAMFALGLVSLSVCYAFIFACEDI
jgi:hypothetical protein